MLDKTSILLSPERAAVAAYGRKMVQTGLTAGTGGNISILNRELGLVAISPSGLDYFETEPADVVVTDLDGGIVDGARKPSSELDFHLALYKARQDAASVTHTHSVHATALACLGRELPAAHYLIGYAGTKVPLVPYATFGSDTLARLIVEHMDGYNAALLQNHGLVAVGGSVAASFAAAEAVEFVARVYILSKSLGEPIIVPDDEMENVLEKFKEYGQK